MERFKTLEELDSYMAELKDIVPKGLGNYKSVDKRACERLLQISLVHQRLEITRRQLAAHVQFLGDLRSRHYFRAQQYENPLLDHVFPLHHR